MRISLLRCLFLFLAILFSPVYAFSDKTSKVVHAYSLEDVQKSYDVNLPIDNEREAIEHAKEQGLLDKIEFEELNKRGYSKWQVSASQRSANHHISIYKTQLRNGIISKDQFENYANQSAKAGSYWEVIVSSRGMLPSYSCQMSLKDSGEMIEGGLHGACGFDK